MHSMYIHTGIILCMRPTNDRRCYHVTSSLIGWVQTENNHCICGNLVLKYKTFLQENALKMLSSAKNGSHYVLKFRFQWVNQFSLIQSLNHFKLHYSSRRRQASWQQIVENISPRAFHSQIEPRFCLNLETMYYNVYRTCFTRAQLSKHVQNDTFWPCHCCYKTIIVNACN